MTTTAPPVLRTATVTRTVEEAFTIFTEEIGAWWPLPTHSVFRERAGGVHFVDGLLVERATDGRETVWAEILAWDRPKRLALAWHPGGDPGPCGVVEVTFAEEAGATRIQIRHDGWEAYGQEAMVQRRSYSGPSAWGHVLDHYTDGAEPRFDGAELDQLEAAYDAFFAEAERGGFAQPVDGGWTAEQVVAHVALNDLALTAVAHALVHRSEPTFDNHTCQVVDLLDGVVAACGDLAGLVAHGRRCAIQAVGAARRLDPDQRASAVPCRFEHDGEIVAEQAMPWGQVAIEIQAARHLPAHVEQLQDLRR